MSVIRCPHVGALLVAFVVGAAGVGQFPSWSRGSLHPEDASISGSAGADLASAGVTASGNIVAAAAAVGSGPWQVMRRMIRSEKAPAVLASLGSKETIGEHADAEAQAPESEQDAEAGAGTYVADMGPKDKTQGILHAVSAQEKIALEQAACSLSAAACQTLAESMGLQVGGNGYPFQGNYSTTGCYAYSAGEYKNIAYYGLYNGAEITSLSAIKNVMFPKYRPNGYGCAEVKVPLSTNWTAYSSWWGTPSFTVNAGVCTVFGLPQVGRFFTNHTVVAQLPSYCRPSKKLIFGQRSGWGASRVDVEANGTVTWGLVTTRTDGTWLSLSGIHFTVSTTNEKPLTLAASWASMGGALGGVTYQILEGMCVLEGAVVAVGAKMVAGSTSPSIYNGTNGTGANDTAIIAVLPTTCRPSKRLVFNVFTNASSNMARVDVLPDGRMIWIEQSDTKWLSLTGISFSIGLAGQQPLELRPAGGWQAYGGEYGAPTYVLTNGLCIIEGVVSVGATWTGDVALLPRSCLPESNLIFDVKVSPCTARVDVYTTGIMKWNGGCTNSKWMSLAGIIFEPQRPQVRINTQRVGLSVGAWFRDWSSWPTCSASCGGGSQTRTRLAQGLLGEYYYIGKTGKVTPSEVLDTYTPDIVRADLLIDFPSIGLWNGLQTINNFCVRWTGFLNISIAGAYTFSITSDDGSVLFIDGDVLPLGTNKNATSLTVDNDGGHGMVAKTGTVTLKAGLHPIRLLYWQGSGGLGMILAYQGPDTSQVFTVVPRWALSHTAKPVYTGLMGEYFFFPQGTSLPNLAGVTRNWVRADQVLNFFAAAGSQWPMLTVQNDLAVRWTGELLITTGGQYMFDITSDDGVQMWIGSTVLTLKNCNLCLAGEQMADPSNTTLIADGIHKLVTVTANVTLAAGYHAIRIEYFNKADDSGITFAYDGPDVSTEPSSRRRRVVVPSKVLRLPSTDYTELATETTTCNTQKCPVNCVVGNWSEWTTCSKTCGGGVSYHQRAIITPAQFGGTPCPNSTQDSKPCGDTPCPVNCVWSDWASWTDCSLTCGAGTKERTRTVKVQAAFNGTACGPDFKQTVPCGPPNCPVDCEWALWSEWTACVKTCGWERTTRKRNTSKVAAFGGRNCTGNPSEEKSCGNVPCPGDCVWGNWSAWTPCSKTCGMGQTMRTRQIAVPNTNGGKACWGSNNETEGCNPQGCPVDCVWSNWTPFTNCSKTCGGGVQVRTRNASGTPAWGGKACTGDARQEEVCNSQGCPVDCVWSNWSAFSNCSATCAGGTRFKTRSVVSPAVFGGRDCNLSQAMSQETCNTQPCPIQCVWDTWTTWSPCTRTCGGGITTRNRTVKVQAKYGGANCTGDAGQQTQCNTDGCKVDCVWGNWSNWTRCSTSCGGGVRRQWRRKTTEAAFGGLECQGDNVTQEACNTAACPVDCLWGDWENWTACSVTCGDGVKYRVRAQFTSQFDGKPCVGLPREDSGCRRWNQSGCPTTTIPPTTTTMPPTTASQATSTTTAAPTTTTTPAPTTTRTTSTTLTAADGTIMIPSNSTTIKGDVLLKVPNPDAFAKDVVAIAAMTDTVSVLTGVAVGLVQVKITSVPALIQLSARRLSTRDGLVDCAYTIVMSKEEATSSVVSSIQTTLSVSNLPAIQTQLTASLVKINGTSGATAAANMKVESVIAATVTQASSKETANGGPITTAPSTTTQVVNQGVSSAKGVTSQTTAKPTVKPTIKPVNISKWQNMSKNSSPWGSSPGGASPSARASCLVTLALATALFAVALPTSHEA